MTPASPIKARRARTSRTGPKIGLFGGSFNPAHEGHRLVAQCGLTQGGLDEVWWLVSPGNPLKAQSDNYAQRAASVKALGLPRAMKVSHLERDMGMRYTIDMLRAAKRRYPNARFVWLMGADNLLQMPAWKNWQALMREVPILVVGRPGAALKARLGRASSQFARYRLSEYEAGAIGSFCAPCWTYLTPPLSSLSSTKIRAAQGRPVPAHIDTIT